MTLSPTLFIYIGRQFLLWFLAVFFIMIAVIILVDAVELLRVVHTTASRELGDRILGIH